MTGPDLSTVLAEERRIMNLYAPHYDTAVLTNSYVYQFERSRFADWTTRMLRDTGRDLGTLSVLDAGSGTGSGIDLLAQAGFRRLTGIDAAEAMLGEARKRRLTHARWVMGAIEDPPFSIGAFDVILGCFTLHHLHDPSAFFRLVDRTLRPGGWFFVLDYDADSGVSETSQNGTRRALGKVVRRFFTLKNRRALASRPVLAPLFNPAHRLLSFEDIRRAMLHPERYEVRREPRGVLLPALLPVLVEESAFDRAVARSADAADRWLAPRFGGTFQWIAGRRRPSTAPLPAVR